MRGFLQFLLVVLLLPAASGQPPGADPGGFAKDLRVFDVTATNASFSWTVEGCDGWTWIEYRERQGDERVDDAWQNGPWNRTPERYGTGRHSANLTDLQPETQYFFYAQGPACGFGGGYDTATECFRTVPDAYACPGGDRTTYKPRGTSTGTPETTTTTTTTTTTGVPLSNTAVTNAPGGTLAGCLFVLILMAMRRRLD